MFFIGIFGVEGREKLIKDINNITCSTCGKLSVYRIMKRYEVFHIFFIPVFKWNVKYYAVSRCCNSVYEVDLEKGKALEYDDNLAISEEDFKLVSRGRIQNTCSNCRRIVDEGFSYCPYCGQKI